MIKKYSENLFDRLVYNDKQIIKNYNLLIRSKEGQLLLETGLSALAGLGAIGSLITLCFMNPENYPTEQIYGTIYNSVLASGGVEALFALGIPFVRHKAHKTIRDEIIDYLAGKYETCVCNEAGFLQNPIIGCEPTGDLTEAPQTLTRK